MARRSVGGGGQKSSRGFHPGFIAAAALIVLVAFAIFSGGDRENRSGAPSITLKVVSGSENKPLEPIIQEWARGADIAVEMSYLGSVEIARELEKGAATEFDAVWPAHSLWIAYGDEKRLVKNAASIMRSPVALGVKRSLAQRLGWVGRTDISFAEIKGAAERGEFRLAMTSATQSNSGASAYFGFLYALAGQPNVLKLADLEKPALREGARKLLAAVDRSSGSSGWLKDAFVANPDRFDAMFNYEAVLIEANQAFVKAGREPLYLIYPADGLAVADSPLGFVAKGGPASEEKAAAFAKLQAHLLSKPVQNRLVGLGRRAGLIGLDVGNVDRAVWNPEWGVDPRRAIAPIPTPARPVIARALSLYQTELRKPSLTIWVLDVSSSMEGRPLAELKRAMALLLDPDQAERALLSASPDDVTVVIAFNHLTAGSWSVSGNEPAALRDMLREVRRLQADGGTDMYRALVAALARLTLLDGEGALTTKLPAIVVMTDGRSRGDRDAFLRELASTPFGRDIPIHAIAFGNADVAQLEELTRMTVGRLFKAGDDLVGALRRAKGYN